MTNKVKAWVTSVSAGLMSAFLAISAFAEGETADLSAVTDYSIATDLDGIKGLFGSFSTTNLLSIIGGALALAIPLVIFWFGFRWIWSKVKSSFKKGNA